MPSTSLLRPVALTDLLGRVTVLDVRWRLGRDDGREAYAAGHVPTAAYVDLETALADPPADPVDHRGRHPLPEPARFAAAMRAAGVREGRPVVVYDDWSSLAAARAWWLLRQHHGHRDVRVLDGGWAAWQQAGGEVAVGHERPTAGDFTAGPGRLPVVDAGGAAALAETGRLLDARAPERFRGETEPVDPVAGHVPGAVNVPATDNVRDGRFLPVAELAERYAVVEHLPDERVAVYCGSGVTAAHDVLALHLLGREVALYPGSWSGWLAVQKT